MAVPSSRQPSPMHIGVSYQPSATRRYDPHLTILFFLWLFMLAAVLPRFFATGAAAPTPPTLTSVNPNVAPWWELTVLPQIGPHTAREIIRYRESAGRSSASGENSVAFRRTADLAQVRGIGPKTLQRIGRYLSFDDDYKEARPIEGGPMN